MNTHTTKKQAPWLDMATSVIRRHVKGQEQWHYEHGLMLGAIDLVGQTSGRPEFQEFVRSYMETLVAPDGSIKGYRHTEFNLDQVNPGKVLFGLLERTGDQRWRKALDT